MEYLPCGWYFANTLISPISFANNKNNGEVQALSQFYRRRHKGFESFSGKLAKSLQLIQDRARTQSLVC